MRRNPFDDMLWRKCYSDLQYKHNKPPTWEQVDAARANLAAWIERGEEQVIITIHGVSVGEPRFPATPAEGVRHMIYAGMDWTDAWDRMVRIATEWDICLLEIAFHLSKSGNLTNCELYLCGTHPYKGQADGCQQWNVQRDWDDLNPWKEYIL